MKGGIWPIHTSPDIDEDTTWIDDIQPDDSVTIFDKLEFKCTFQQLKEQNEKIKEHFDNGLDFIFISPSIKNNDKRKKEKEWQQAVLRYFYVLLSQLQPEGVAVIRFS